MHRRSLDVIFDALRRSFWLFPFLAMLVGGGLGFLVPMLDSTTGGSLGIFTTSDNASARGLLETIATVTVSVAGIAFSVTVVALQLASQQLGPRVLRTFQTDRLNQATLAAFLGVFVYALTALGRLSTIELGEGVSSPNAVLTFGVGSAIVAFVFFAAFIQNVVISLQASTIIQRIAEDATEVVENPYPSEIGRAAEGGRHGGPPPAAASSVSVGARRAGFFNSIPGDRLLASARECGGVVVQRVQLGDFVIEGMVIADCYGESAEQLAQEIAELADIGQERTLVQDVSLPVRQLADVALRALSPSLNDPTTAENAMGSIAQVLAHVARTDPVHCERTDEDGRVRFVALAAGLDDLVRLGFEQVRLHSQESPVFRRRTVRLLEELRNVARKEEAPMEEIEAQLAWFRD